jgi:predicted GNAT family acetyltransferase
MPVLCGKKEIPSPLFLRGLLRGIKLHSVQGLRKEVIVLEKELEQLGGKTGDIFDYDLMSIDKPPNIKGYSTGPANLILRAPQLVDLDAVAALQAAYEQEEVLPKGSVFSPLSSRTNTTNIISKSHILAAELGGRLVGKININAVSFTRYQVGGVYVCPDFRGLGIASRMAAEFIGSLILQGRGVTLFVRKTNLAARKLYAGLGFSIRGDYRISYY